jgi:hypothetical protein
VNQGITALAARSVPSRRLRSALACFALFTGIVVILQILKLPQNLDYAAFAFGEPGSNLNVAYLVQHGLRPAVDFGHPYGLLEVLVLDLWFRLARLTPLAYLELIFLLQVLMAAVLAEFVVVAELPWFRILFMVAALPVFLWVNYFRAAHAIETLCLLAAITAHLKGRYDVALAATAAAVLARPALGYVYGAFLVSVVAIKIVRGGLKSSVLLLPFFSTVGLLLLLTWRFGLTALLRTIFPAAGMANYRILGFGFFGRGMAFWRPSPFTIHHYFGVPGFWLLAAVTVMVLGPVALLRVGDTGGTRQRKAEIVCASAALVFVWIFFAFSHQYIGGWILYLFFPVIGVSLLGDFFPRFGVVLGLMVLIALNANRHDIASSVDAWRTAHRSTLFPHMLSYGNEDELCRQIFDAVRNHRTAVLQYSGAVSLLHSGLGEPRGEWFQPGITLPKEISQERSDVAAAELVLIPMPRWHSADTTAFQWPDYLDRGRRNRMVLQNPIGIVLTADPQAK